MSWAQDAVQKGLARRSARFDEHAERVEKRLVEKEELLERLKDEADEVNKLLVQCQSFSGGKLVLTEPKPAYFTLYNGSEVLNCVEWKIEALGSKSTIGNLVYNTLGVWLVEQEAGNMIYSSKLNEGQLSYHGYVPHRLLDDLQQQLSLWLEKLAEYGFV